MSTPEASYNPPLNRSVRHNSTYRIRNTTLTSDMHTSKLRLLSKHIKSNDVNQILGGSHLAQLGKRDDVEVAEAEKREAISNIASLRKKLDETRDMYNKREQEMNKIKLELEKIKSDEDFEMDHTQKNGSKLEQLKDTLDIQKIKLEEALLNKKTLEAMLDRTKKDKIVDQMKTGKLEKELMMRGRDYSVEFINGIKVKQFKVQTQNVFSEVVKQAEEEDKRRQENLFLFEKAVISKEEAEKSREDRIMKTENMARSVAKEVANNDEKQYRSLLLVHKFVHLFMKKEMEDEMRKHQKVEHAFQRIRATTGISDAAQFVEKFLKREEAYSELLVSIANYEKKVEEAKKKNEGLHNIIQSLKEKSVALEKQRAEQKAGNELLNETYKELREKTDICKTAKIKFEQVYSWAIRALLKMDKAQHSTKNNYHEVFPKGKAGSAMLQVIQAVAGHLKSIKEHNYEKVLDEIDGAKIDNQLSTKEFIAKNLRVKTRDVIPALSETPKSDDSSRSRSKSRSSIRNPTPHEMTQVHKRDSINVNHPDTEEGDIELHFDAKRKEIKVKQAQLAMQRKQMEKLNKEEN